MEQNQIIVELDSTLEKKELTATAPEKFNENICDEGKTTVRDCIFGTYRHVNYLSYLQKAWGNHYGIVISPDIFWHLILSEVSGHIKENSKHYKKLFTSSDKKVEISVPTFDPQLIDLNLIADELRYLVPTNIDLFLPEFTSTTASSSMAFMAAFADAMTPYYNYSMYMCGIPKIKIRSDKYGYCRQKINLIKFTNNQINL